jgi:hypothetical protein
MIRIEALSGAPNRWSVEWFEVGEFHRRLFATPEESVLFAREIVEYRRQNREEARDV